MGDHQERPCAVNLRLYSRYRADTDVKWINQPNQFVLNSAARAVTKTSKFHLITPILKSLHWLKINERIQYKVLSLTYKSIPTGHPCYLRSLLSFTPNRSTRSSSFITLNLHTNTSRLRISNKSFCHCAPVLWNNLPPDLRQFSHHLTSSTSSLNSPVSDLSTSLFLKKLKTHLFHFFCSVVFIHLCFLWTDISGTDLALLFHLTFMSYHSSLFHSCQLFLFSFVISVKE